MFYAIDLVLVGKKEEAKREAQRSLELSPGDTVSLYNAACFYSQIKEKALAIDTMHKAILAG